MKPTLPESVQSLAQKLGLKVTSISRWYGIQLPEETHIVVFDTFNELICYLSGQLDALGIRTTPQENEVLRRDLELFHSM